jgi:hypothetical protein
MSRVVLLDNVEHHDLRILLGHDARFGDAVNQLLAFPTEFEALQREYPIFFRQGPEGAFQSVVLTGLDRDENLFLDGGRWNARYVPAIQRRGPFSIAMRRREGEDAAEPLINVDLDHPRISRSEGEPVFLPQGGNAPVLQGVSQALQVIFDGVEATAPFFDALARHDLIEPVALQVSLSETERYDVPGLHTVAQDRLAALAGPALEELNRTGVLRAAFLVAASLGNVERLIVLKNARRGAA